MTDAISHDEIQTALGRATYNRSLVYVIGPYKSFDLSYVLSEEELTAIGIGDPPGPIRKLFAAWDEVNNALVLPRWVQGTFHADPGVNALLAVNIGPNTDEVDATTRSLVFVATNSATVFVLPFLDHDFDIGEKARSILKQLLETYGDRIVFTRGATVMSEIIRAMRAHWDFRVETHDTEAELYKRIRPFVVNMVGRELHDGLDRLG